MVSDSSAGDRPTNGESASWSLLGSQAQRQSDGRVIASVTEVSRLLLCMGDHLYVLVSPDGQHTGAPARFSLYVLDAAAGKPLLHSDAREPMVDVDTGSASRCPRNACGTE